MNANEPQRVLPKRRDLVPIFRLRLHNGRSIGPALLKRLWALAAGAEEVGVARDGHGPAGSSSYIVSATSVPPDVATVESRLRRLLQEKLSAAHIQLMRLA